ncbi:MAG TPA: GNAT family N-acetyltransferase [Leptolyngbyaceae cyanobacterium M33_DOE_097]|uniref:GNAT family N-acetyltransferase n=1 Tax=Oscillatoriales cyanobacterium SpSt-418 TaxID=2282169 RepID=A0A7C3KIC4_9CYAN|nr:GNAT family N-acetyltransferase [Leptolyngbyaceae cyanobacterium M33_DOE_097]
MQYTIRALTNDDEPIVWEMLMHAAHESEITAVQSQVSLVGYAANWGRAGDMGFVAVCEQQPIGAAWLRLWKGQERGFGYIADEIPELAIAVLPEYYGNGIGSNLLLQLIEAASKSYPAISLNVRDDNPAVRLYQRVGFVKVAGSEAPNRVGGTSFNMLYRFN